MPQSESSHRSAPAGAFSPSKQELALAQWTFELGIQGIEDIFVRLYSELLSEWAETPRYQWLRRRQLLEQADGARRLFVIAQKYRVEQERA